MSMNQRRPARRIVASAVTLITASLGMAALPATAYAESTNVTVNYGDWNCPTGYGGARGVVIRITGVTISPPGESRVNVSGRSATLPAILRQNVNVDAALTCKVKISWWGQTQDFPNVPVNVIRYFQFGGHNM